MSLSPSSGEKRPTPSAAKQPSKRQRISKPKQPGKPKTAAKRTPKSLETPKPKKKDKEQTESRPNNINNSDGSEPKKRRFGKRNRAPKTAYHSALKTLGKTPWFALESNAKDAAPTFIVKKYSPPAQISMIHLVNWLFDMPNGGVDLVTYNYLFGLLKAEGALHYQRLSVNASQHLVGHDGANLSKWLHSTTTAAKKYASVLQPGVDRTEYNLIVAESLPLVVKRVREMVGVSATLCSIFLQSRSKVNYYDLVIRDVEAKLYTVSSRTFSSYQKCKEVFNFSEALVEGILQRHLLARQSKNAQAVPQTTTLNVDTYRFQDVFNQIDSVWNELRTEHDIVKECLDRMEVDIHVSATAQTTHTSLRNWIVHVSKAKGLEVPNDRIMMNSRIYSMVADAISLHFEIPIHQKRPIKIAIDVGTPLKTGVRTNHSTDQRRKRREKAAQRALEEEKEAAIAASPAVAQSPATPARVVPPAVEDSSEGESSAFNEGDEAEPVDVQHEEGEVESDDGNSSNNKEAANVDEANDSSEMEDVYG